MDVRLHLRERAAVDLQELHLRIGGRHFRQHVVELEADRDDDLGARLGRGLEVLPASRRVGAFVGLRFAAQRLRRPLGADLAELEEVVDAERVRRNVDEERLVGGEALAGEKGGERENEGCGALHG